MNEEGPREQVKQEVIQVACSLQSDISCEARTNPWLQNSNWFVYVQQ